jgi:putative ABC transport system substrate-binding protein
MDRRRFLLTSLAGAFAAPLAAQAQQAKVARIGLLAIASREAELEKLEAFWQAMRERGWVKGQNVVIEERWADGKVERLASFAAELVRRKVDLIIAPGQAAALAARSATTTVPIVMIAFDDPVRSGLVSSLARPGGNVTGVTYIAEVGIIGKQLQMLTEVVPNLSSVALLKDPADPRATSVLTEMQGAARSLRLRVQVVNVRGPDELEGAFATIARERAGAVLVQPSGMFYVPQSRLVTLAAKHRLPAIFWRGDWVEAGGLISYGGADYLELLRRSATYVDRILKGAKPADLPVEQPTKFELVINLKTAKALGLTIPPSLLLRADQVIE